VRIEEYADPEYAERMRNILSAALDECKLPYAFQKDRLLARWTEEILLAKA
jgi:hypothetical protein